MFVHLRPNTRLQHLLDIVNNALDAGYFPNTLKHAHVIFIPKGNISQYNIKNHRSISLLDIQGKLFDKILNTRLTHHSPLTYTTSTTIDNTDLGRTGVYAQH